MIDTLIRLEIDLVKTFHWSLKDIDETDVESMMDFLVRIGRDDGSRSKKMFCDQVDIF